MKTEELTTIEHRSNFLEGTQAVAFTISSDKDRSSRWAPQQVRIVLAFSVCRLVSHRCRNILSVLSHHHTPH
ncbi:hypothetical protein, partial [Thiolapillus sp.]|uniref:hypothetical protein n=1 Tax=Thiolapillus sp. TaxID=2017437 RepID=UPI0025E02B9C